MNHRQDPIIKHDASPTKQPLNDHEDQSTPGKPTKPNALVAAIYGNQQTDRQQTDQPRHDLQQRQSGEQSRGEAFADAQRQSEARAARQAQKSDQSTQPETGEASSSVHSQPDTPADGDLFV